MLRAVFLATCTLLSMAVPALAEPQLGDDLTVCRDRQNDLKTRAEACEKVIAGGKAAPKDLAVALLARGEVLAAKRDYDKAIAVYTDALKSDPDNVRAMEGRDHEQGV
jgi:tetratricopeptide (TPR) repeat protein